MDLNYYLDKTQLGSPDNEGTKPPKICPRCGYNKLIRIHDEFEGIYFYECFNLIKSYLGTCVQDGYQHCGYRWDYPKNRENVLRYFEGKK